MSKYKKAVLIIICCISVQSLAQPGFNRELWLQKAEDLKPELIHQTRLPQQIVEVDTDPQAFHGYKITRSDPISALSAKTFSKGDQLILDYGDHLVGRLSFDIKTNGPAADAPTRLILKFGEILPEVVEPYDPYQGQLSRAWLQDEVINIDTIPTTIKLPRRYAFRYLSVEVIATSPVYNIELSGFAVDQVSAVQMQDLVSLPSGVSTDIKNIDRVSNRTLQDCMQTVYEDGPKRDRRLWVGDLRLQALTNYQTFKDLNLVKRSIYLLAGVADETGRVPGCVFEVPYPHRQDNFPLDYSLLFNTTIYDYVQYTGDFSLARELWPVMKKQVELARPYLENGIFKEPAQKDWWIFVDWQPGLDKQVAMQGIMIYTFRHTYLLAQEMGVANQVDFIPDLIDQMTKMAIKEFYDSEAHLFRSGPDRQVSIASQAWMILSEVVNQKRGARIMKNVLGRKDVINPAAPYLYHYQLEAMLTSGMSAEAKSLLLNYWGSMINDGADTFWEVYDPQNPDFSPYNSVLVNSYCHAWSCTPSYFIRKYPEVFQVEE